MGTLKKMESAQEAASDDDEHMRLYIDDESHSPSPSTLKEGPSASAEKDTRNSIKRPDMSEKHGITVNEGETSTSMSAHSKVNEGFSWPDYLKETKSKAALPECFFQDRNPPVNNFKTDMKVEVPDLRGNGTHCLATIQHVHSVWICVRLDGEDASNDHWMICDDRFILPVGSNKKKGNPIQPPYGYKHNISAFHRFIENQLKPRPDGTSPAAPPEVFKPISSAFHPQRNKFEVGMKCEAIDYKNFNGRPCPATIVELDDDYVTINFDGWNDSYNLRMRYDSRYLFPVGWSAKNGLEINPPRKMQGKMKPGLAKKEAPQKQSSTPKSASRLASLKTKATPVQQVQVKKRKSTSSTSSAPPPGRKPRLAERESSGSVHTPPPQQKPAAETRVERANLPAENHASNVKVEREDAASQSESPSSIDQKGQRQTPAVRTVSPMQRPVARKTMPPGQQVQNVESTLVLKQAQPVRVPLATHPVQPTVQQPPRSTPASNVMGPRTTQVPVASQSVRPIVVSQPVQTVRSPVVTQTVQNVQQLQPQTSSRQTEPTVDKLRLITPKSKNWPAEKKFADESPKPPVASTSNSGSDIVLTTNDGATRTDASKMVVYVNRYCQCSPVLDNKKVEKMPVQIGPASVHHVFREILQQIVNCAVDPVPVINEIRNAPSHILSVTAEIGGVTHVRALPIPKAPSDAWDYLRGIIASLQICPNFVKDTPTICPSCKIPENDASIGDTSDSGRSSHPQLSESGDSLSSEDGRLPENALANWSIDKVAQVVEATFDASVANRFQQNQIDGQAFMLLTTDLLMQYLDMPFGPALKMVSFVETLTKKYRR